LVIEFLNPAVGQCQQIVGLIRNPPAHGLLREAPAAQTHQRQGTVLKRDLRRFDAHGHRRNGQARGARPSWQSGLRLARLWNGSARLAGRPRGEFRRWRRGGTAFLLGTLFLAPPFFRELFPGFLATLFVVCPPLFLA
jgi:hypothetical protein